jgi:hypothetical protein
MIMRQCLRMESCHLNAAVLQDYGKATDTDFGVAKSKKSHGSFDAGDLEWLHGRRSVPLPSKL